MDLTKRKNIILYLALAVVIVALLVVAALLDSTIAQKLYVKNDSLGFVIEAIGKVPAFAICGFASIILLLCTKLKTQTAKAWVITLKIAYIVAGIGFFSLAFKDFFDLIFEGKTVYIGCLGMGVIVYLLCLIPLYKERVQSLLKYKKWAITSAIAVCVIAVLVMAIKLIWGRERFIDSLNSGNATKLWLIPQRLGGESMPSGHVAFASTALLLLPLCKINSKLENCEYKLLFCVALYIILVAFSRMRAGAHYLSDVSVAVAIVTVVTIVTNLIAFGKSADSIYFKQNNVFDKLF